MKRRVPGFLAALMPHNVTWANESTWIPAFGVPLTNIYYWASRLVPLFAALQFNESDAYRVKLPPLDVLYFTSPTDIAAYDWHRSFLDIVLSGHQPRMEYAGTAWDADLSSESPTRGNNWKCFRRATMLSGHWATVCV